MSDSRIPPPRAWGSAYLCGASPDQLAELGVDADLVSSCSGEGDIFPALWSVAERYVRRGDRLYVAAGMEIIQTFASRLPQEDVVDLLEWHFQPVVPWSDLPVPDPRSYRALVAVALAGPDQRKPAPMEPAHRLVALLGRIIATAPREGDRLLARQALRAIEQQQQDWYERRTSLEEALLEGRPMDPDLVERCGTPFENGRYVEAVREAMIVFEERVRLAGDTLPGLSGNQLFSSVFNPNDNASLNPGAASAERIGFVNMLTGPYAYFRNPASHRRMNLDRNRCVQILQLVDLQLGLVYDALTTRHSPEAYLAPGSFVGDARVERVVHYDLDGDGRREKLILYSAMTRYGWRGLLYVCLREDASGGWERLRVADDDVGPPFVRLLRAEVVSLAASSSQVAVWWDRGEGGASLMVLRLANDRLARVPFDNPWDLDYPQPDLSYALRDGRPLFRETDSDGRPEVHAVITSVVDPWGSPEVPRQRATFVVDPQLTRFSVAVRADVES